MGIPERMGGNSYRVPRPDRMQGERTGDGTDGERPSRGRSISLRLYSHTYKGKSNRMEDRDRRDRLSRGRPIRNGTRLSRMESNRIESKTITERGNGDPSRDRPSMERPPARSRNGRETYPPSPRRFVAAAPVSGSLPIYSDHKETDRERPPLLFPYYRITVLPISRPFPYPIPERPSPRIPDRYE